MAIVRKGDTVLATVRASAPLTTFFNDSSALRARLQTAGFQVVSIDDPILSGVFRSSEWKNLLVSVIPLTSDYGSPNDIASIVAGAASETGYNVDFNHVSGQIVQTGSVYGQPILTYGQNADQPLPPSQKGVFDDLSGVLGVSKSTLQLAGLAIAAIVAVSFIRK